MTNDKITEINLWLEEFTAGFIGDNEFVNTNIGLKKLHTFKVASEMTALAGDIGLNEKQRKLATIIGLLHDCGRFEQIVRYRTFNDAESENHALLGIRVIEGNEIIADMPQDEQTIIKESIRSHNARTIELSPQVPEQTMLFARMIRDADKLDIFRVVKVSYEQYLRDPSKANNMAINFDQDTGKCSQNVLEDLIAHRQVDYTKLKTLDDRKLLQLCWVYDINFDPVLKKIVDRGYIKMIFDALAKTDEMEIAKETIQRYLARRIGYTEDQGRS
jgi:hypothetical protein